MADISPRPQGEDDLRVALVLATSTGGVGRHIAALAAALRDRRLRVVVFGPAASNALFGFSDPSGAAAGRFVPTEIGRRLRPRKDALAVWKLRPLLRAADVVHAHGIRAGAVAALSLAGLRDAPALVVTWHNAVLGSRRKRRLGAALERWVARRADLVLAVSPDLVDRLSIGGGSPVERAQVAASTGSVSRSRSQVRAEFGLAAPDSLVLAIGRLHSQKGFDVLAAAADLLIDSGSRVVVVIAGEGPARPELEVAVAAGRGDVRLLGHRDDVADLIAAADVVVMPSRWEGWPLAAGQVLAAGRPLVASAVGGLPELLGSAALLVPPEEPAALAEAIGTVLADAGLAASLSRAATARAGELPTNDDVADSVLAAYRRAVAERRRSRTRSKGPR